MASRREVLALYRSVLRQARAFPERSVGRKLQYNARELIRLRRDETNQPKCARLVTQGYEALRVYELLAKDAQLLSAITRK